MGQNVTRKKRGRPPKADPGAGKPPGTERHPRRSLRRRNVKYFELDDYFDDDDEVFDNDEEHRRKAKKLKLLLNIQSGRSEIEATPPGWSCSRRVDHAPYTSAPFPKIGGKPFKTREFKNEIDKDIDYSNDDASDGDNKGNSAEEVIEEQPEPIAEYSPSGTPSYGLPLPDKKLLELILNKLQKKDIYGVYAEPVDPEELPDYHDKIKHPMDFATVRNNLRNGSYESMEQFEHDVFLICSNAMQYNEPYTIYHKQARLIKEMAIKKFQKIRLKAECSVKDFKPEKKFRPVNGDVHFEGNHVLNDNFDEGEMQTGKGTLSRFFDTNACDPDENRRATCTPSLAHSLDSSESLFITFKGESQQLIPVGLYSDHSYARSLARFAATLGPVAWKFASNRIRQALPQGITFGRGWVGDPEPLPTPGFLLENCAVKEPPFLAKVQPLADHRKFKNVTFSSKNLENEAEFFVPKAITPSAPSIIASFAAKDTQKPSLVSSNLSTQHQKSQSRTSVEPHKKILNQFESRGPPTFYKPHEREQGPSNAVQFVRVLSEEGRNQQAFLNQSLINNASSQLLTSVPSSFSNDSSLDALYAARAWVPVGPGQFGPAEGNLKQLNNQICFDSPSNSLSFIQPQDYFPFSGGMHVQETQFHNQQTTYPNLMTADMSRLPIQPTWWNHRPNLENDFQSPDPAVQLRHFI